MEITMTNQKINFYNSKIGFGIKASVLLLLLATQEIVSRGSFGGGFATGALLGTGITLAATSGSRGDRSPEYYESRRDAHTRSEINRQIKEEKREITRLKSKIKKLERKLDKDQYHNNSDDSDHKRRRTENKDDIKNEIKDYKDQIKDHQDTIEDLKVDLRSL